MNVKKKKAALKLQWYGEIFHINEISDYVSSDDDILYKFS